MGRWQHNRPLVVFLVFPFLVGKQKLTCASLSREIRAWALNPANEYRHMLECLDLTLGCWRGTGWYSGTCELDLKDLAVSTSSDNEFSDMLVDSSHSEKMADMLRGCLARKCGIVSWLCLRARLDLEMMRSCRAQPWVVIGGKRWRHQQDVELDKKTFRLKHFCKRWLQDPRPDIREVHPAGAAVYMPECPSPSRDVHQLAEKIQRGRFYAAGHQQWNHLSVTRAAQPLDCFNQTVMSYSSQTLYESVDCSAIAVPFLARALLEVPSIVTRLCDINDREMTPCIFLSGIQQYWRFLPERLFGISVPELLRCHARIFSLDAANFWNSHGRLDVGTDPLITEDLRFASWRYTRAIQRFEATWLDDLRRYVARRFPQLTPFDGGYRTHAVVKVTFGTPIAKNLVIGKAGCVLSTNACY
eukprot:Protomagalhaensia_sp_Gyna_25__5899@NODE_895_length_2448_cov_376_657119_g706_i0_p1_GENE_NODE_895_length_2448_cov_376_657119_g706_i0NODE_895_length_2448_cov_376_657119_g706_i0_p1_ORF_typecomplete_len415_score46_34_NODE_895_length_2448_cov_376_657119_g706_i07081952